MADAEVLEVERSLQYRAIIEKKRRQLHTQKNTLASQKSPTKLSQTFATTAEGQKVNLKFTSADQEISVISKASSRMDHLLDKTPERSSNRLSPKTSDRKPQNRDLDTIMIDEETPRLQSLSMAPVEKPSDDVHETIDKLTKPPGATKGKKPKTTFLPEGKEKGALKKFDFARLSRSRQSSTSRASQMKIKRKTVSKSPSSKTPFTVRDRLNNQLCFLIKTYGEKHDKNSISFNGLGKILCGLGVLKHFEVSDLDINEFTINKIKVDPIKAKEEARLHDELWHFLHFYCFEDTELVAASLVKAMLRVLMTQEPDQEGIKELRATIDEYLINTGWQLDQIEEFNNYVEEEIEAAKRLPLFKIFLKFDQLKRQAAFTTPMTKISYDSPADPVSEYKQQLNKLKKAYNIKENPLTRSSLLFEGYEFTFIPDHSNKLSKPAKTGDFEDIIQRKSFSELQRETEAEHLDVAFNYPMKRAAAVERQAIEREQEDKENFNQNLVSLSDTVSARNDPVGSERVLSSTRVAEETEG